MQYLYSFVFYILPLEGNLQHRRHSLFMSLSQAGACFSIAFSSLHLLININSSCFETIFLSLLFADKKDDETIFLRCEDTEKKTIALRFLQQKGI